MLNNEKEERNLAVVRDALLPKLMGCVIEYSTVKTIRGAIS